MITAILNLFRAQYNLGRAVRPRPLPINEAKIPYELTKLLRQKRTITLEELKKAIQNKE